MNEENRWDFDTKETKLQRQYDELNGNYARKQFELEQVMARRAELVTKYEELRVRYQLVVDENRKLIRAKLSSKENPPWIGLEKR